MYIIYILRIQDGDNRYYKWYSIWKSKG